MGADWDARGRDLIVVLCAPRSGSTMLRMMLDSHSQVAATVEPHLLVPLRYAGYFGQPRAADYDAVNAALGLRGFVEGLPGGEEAYVDACRAYAGTLYARARAAKATARRFVDKTPQNSLEWPFVAKLFPDAHYLVLVRHPLGILDSVARSFFDGDYDRALAAQNVLADYLPRLADFLREAAVPRLRIAYEALVEEPEVQARRLLEWLGLAYEEAVVEYGRVEHAHAVGGGDPLAAHRRARPVATSREGWVATLRRDPRALAAARRAVEPVAAEDFAALGYEKAKLFDPVERAGAGTAPAAPASRRLSAYLLRRRAYFLLRGVARRAPVRRALLRLRYYADVLLRE